MNIANTPSVQGFKWSPAPGFVPTVPGEDGWCMRDAVCQLFGWRPGSEEWLRFIEAPTGRDLIRLARHLGLTVFEVGAPGSWDELSHHAAHPGVADITSTRSPCAPMATPSGPTTSNPRKCGITQTFKVTVRVAG